MFITCFSRPVQNSPVKYNTRILYSRSICRGPRQAFSSAPSTLPDYSLPLPCTVSNPCSLPSKPTINLILQTLFHQIPQKKGFPGLFQKTAQCRNTTRKLRHDFSYIQGLTWILELWRFGYSIDGFSGAGGRPTNGVDDVGLLFSRLSMATLSERACILEFGTWLGTTTIRLGYACVFMFCVAFGLSGF